MKTTIRLILAAFVLLVAFSLCTTVVQAQFNYTTNDGTITITGYTGPGGVVTIPASIGGLPVTSIGIDAFFNCGSLSSITIPSGVTNIGDMAFEWCHGLTRVTIGDSVTVGNGVTRIGDCAFSSCDSLTNVVIGSNVNSIGNLAFYCCTRLTSLIIPDSVSDIGDRAFYGCAQLTEITVGPLNPVYSSMDGFLFNESRTTILACPPGTSGNYTIPDSVTNIGGYAFARCTRLTNIVIPVTTSNIEAEAFRDCTGLTHLTIPDSVTSIGEQAFAGCTALTGITIPDSVTTIGDGAFEGCTALTALDLNGSGLTRLTLPGGLTSVTRLDLSGNQLDQLTPPTGWVNLRELRLAHNPLRILSVPAEFSGLTCLDVRETPLATLIVPESLVPALIPPIETLRAQGTEVYAYRLGATTHYVSLESTNPLAPFATWGTAATNIQDAVNVTVAGDTVLVTNGVYATGEKEGNRVMVTNSIRLESVNGRDVTVIEGSRMNPETGEGTDARCVYLGTEAVLSGFTLTNGVGGVVCETLAVVSNCIIANSVTGVSGGTIYNCTIAGNLGGGGASGSVLHNCTLSGNSGTDGGGASSSVLYNCSLTGNTAYRGCSREGCWGGSGGGASGSTLYRCTLADNLADSSGGGASGCTLYNSTLTNNAASGGGGGVDGGKLYNCLLTGNSAGKGGGARGATLYNCTLALNAATGRFDGSGSWLEGAGGGVCGGDLYNCIVYYNTAVNGANYFTGADDYLAVEYRTLLHFSCTTPLPTNGVGNLVEQPLFVDGARGDFQLRDDSPCIDVGTNLVGFSMTTTNVDTGDISVLSYAYEPTDILGNTRFIDGNGDGKVAWDIGAYEFNSWKAPRFAVHPQRIQDGWTLNVTGAPNKWARLQRSGNLKDWEEIWSGWMGVEGVQQVNDPDTGPTTMFYRVVVP